MNRGISLKLEKEGYEIYSAFGVTEAEDIFHTQNIDLIISDITMNDGNGLDFAIKMRKKSDVHIIFLTALDQEVDIVNGYDVGADDYITKPFSLMVLISKVNALMRRIESRQNENEETGELQGEDICLQCAQMKVYKGEEELNLSKKEIQLLQLFLERRNRLFPRSRFWRLSGALTDSL